MIKLIDFFLLLFHDPYGITVSCIESIRAIGWETTYITLQEVWNTLKRYLYG